MRLLLLILLALPASAQPASTLDPPVASWGGFALPQSLFAEAYRAWIVRVPTPDSPQARQAFAHEQLERLIVAERADLASEQRAGAERYAAQERDRALRAAYFRAAVEDTIAPPTGDEVRAAWRRANTQVEAQQLFSPDTLEIARWHAELARGASFDSLARVAAQRYGGDPQGRLGVVAAGDLGLGPERALFALELEGWTEPVASLNGWHVLRMLSRTETVRVDAGGFDAARERLAAELHARRFAEATARMLRARLADAPLAIDARVLRALWPLVAPIAGAPAPDQPRLLEEAAAAPLPDVAPGAVVASWGDGQTLTAQAFVDALPTVERAALRPDLRGAAETVVRDLIVTGWARAAGLEGEPSVQVRARAARLAARYTSALSAVADTLSAAYTEPRTYALLRDELFAGARRFAVRRWTFAERSEAQAAIGGSLDPDAAARDTLSALPGASLGTLAQTPGVPAGPFAREGAWHVVAVDSAWAEPLPPADVADEVAVRAQALRPYWAHRLLLPPAYEPDAVVFDAAALAAALPRYDLLAP